MPRLPPMPHKLTCALFAGTRPVPKDTWEGEWSEFVSDVLPELVARDVPCPRDPTDAQRQAAKRKCPGFVLAPVEGRRTDATTGAHTALAIDVDHLPDNDLGALLKRAKRYQCAVYETPSSTDDAPRVRVIVALDAPLEPEHVIGARRALAEALGLDPAEAGTTEAEAASQVMFAGRLRGTRERGVWVYDGGQVYAAPRIATDTARAKRPRSSDRRGAGVLKQNRTRSERTRTPTRAPSAFPFDAPPDLGALAKYVPPAGVDGDRHLLVRALGGWLGRRGYSPEAIAEAVRLQIPASDPTERAAQAQDAAERVRRGEEAPGWEALSEWAQRYAKGASTVRRLERACRDPREPDGFGVAGVGEVWSEWWAGYWPRVEARFGEIATRAEAARTVTDGDTAVPAGAELDATGLHLHPLTGWPWILQRATTYWLHRVDAKGYRKEVLASELGGAVSRYLAGLLGEDDRKPSELDASWVQPIDHLRARYMAREHTYDPQSNTLTLAALRWTGRAARKHTHIDRWLRALFGDGYAAAAQWLAAVVELDRPAPCLYLPGPRGLGKSLLADGLAALWSRPAPTKMKEAISSFNASVGECPLVFTDEGFPQDLDFNEFREMVTQHSRRVNAKFQPQRDVEGCGRFMIAANNEDVLRYQKIGTLTQDDLDAIADRLLVLPCRVEAREVVKLLDTNAAASHEIAEHVLWLAATVALEPPNERMAAKPGGGERVLASVVVGRNAVVLSRIREAIGTGSIGEQSGVKVPKGAPKSEVWVNIPRLQATFDGKVTLGAIKELCESFALRPGAEQHRSADGDNLCWRVLSRLRLDEAFVKLD